MSDPCRAIKDYASGQLTARRGSSRQLNLSALKRFAAADRDAIRPRINRADIPWRTSCHGESTALTNGKSCAPLMGSNNLPLLVNDLSALWLPAARAQERPIIAIWDEADLLALWLLRGWESARACHLTNLRLSHPPKWEARPSDRVAAEAMQEIRLVFVVIHCSTQAPGTVVGTHRASRIVAGGNRFAAKERTPLPHECAKLHRGIAANAGARRLSPEICANKWLEHRIGELTLKVLNVEWDFQLVRHATRIVRRIKGATTLPPAVHTISSVVKSHPYANHLVSSLYEERCCNGGIYASRECNEHTLRLRRLRLRKPPAGKSVCVHVDRTSVSS
jgi:hypothetical protein